VNVKKGQFLSPFEMRFVVDKLEGAQAASLRPDAGARQPKAVAIGATTADALRKAGIPLAGTAAAPTAVAIRNAVIEALA
jgi:uroporphyrinogen-III synthase